MKISKLETFHADGGWRIWSFLKITADSGLTGWAEYSDGFGAGGVSELIGKFAPLVAGKDPRAPTKISAQLRALTRLATGGLNHQAIAAIENACFDIAGKAAGLPVYALLGGRMRETLPVYWSHCASFRVWRRAFFEDELGMPPIRTLDDVRALATSARERGFAAVKTNPLNLWPQSKPFASGFRMGPGMLERHPDQHQIFEMREVCAAFRDGLGPDGGLMFDLNFNQRPEGFLRIARALEEFDLTWLEIDIHDPDALAHIRAQVRTPIASLESIHGLAAYRAFLEKRAVDVAVIDVLWNGVWESTRIATLADAYEIDCAPHNFYGDLASLMSAHFCAAIPNFRIMEIEIDDVPWK
ncbi:MAG: mandelate racemase/muconate lactonizing enzyme family protein, partial [Alphaproteobacteria bacterium]|nr:mandelate racemase/muconate lactonizing enzyme family protein [Alphaproteobacteria bacterium]